MTLLSSSVDTAYPEEIIPLACGHNRRVHYPDGIIDYHEGCNQESATESIGAGNNETDPEMRRLMPSGLSTADIAAILGIHNTYRSQAAKGLTPNLPSGANVVENVWDAGLATFAQNHVNKCVWGHSTSADRTAIYGTYSGENIYLAPQYPETTTTILNGIQAWYNEYLFYTFNPINSGDCQSGQMCGHLTQIVWAKTTRVGCAYKLCPTANVNGATVTNAIYFSCNYYAGGNYIGSYPYVSGSTCSQCPSTSPYCNNGLCSATNPASASSTATTTTTTTKSPTQATTTTKSPTQATTTTTTRSPTTPAPTPASTVTVISQPSGCCSGRSYCSIWKNDATTCANTRGCAMSTLAC
jgi:hypothetical protein